MVMLVVIIANLTCMSSFFTLAFASFVEVQHDFNMSFSDWLQVLVSSLGVYFELLTLLGYRKGRRSTSGSRRQLTLLLSSFP